MKQLIQNVRLVDPYHHRDHIGDMAIADGVIVGVGSKPVDFTPDTILDATNKIIIPGVIDLFISIPQSSCESKVTLDSERLAAAHVGTTTVCCSPKIHSIMDSESEIELTYLKSQALPGANLLLYGALTQRLQGERLSNMAGLKRAGCVAVTNAYQPIKDTHLVRHCFEYAANVDLPIVIIPQDGYLSEHGLVHEGQINARSGLIGIPAIAESLEVSRVLALSEFTGARVHFSQISAAESVTLIAAAKAKGLPVTADVSINHLFLTEIDISEFDTNCFVLPPLRSLQDQQALIAGLQDGTLDAICSAHMPLDKHSKHCPFNEALPGIASLEVLLSLSFRLVLHGKLSLTQWVACLTEHPAKVIAPHLGQLSIGESANFCLFNPQTEFLCDRHHMRSIAQNLPYDQWLLQGKVELTQIGSAIFS